MKIYYICVISALIALCLVFFVMMAVGNSKGVKIASYVISALCMILSLVIWLVVFRLIDIPFLSPIMDELYFELLALGLTVISTAELGGLLCKRIVSKDKPTVAKDEETRQKQECEISKRKKGERIHGEYTIIRE